MTINFLGTTCRFVSWLLHRTTLHYFTLLHLFQNKLFHCLTTRMDENTRLNNSKWLIPLNQSPHLTKDRFIRASPQLHTCDQNILYTDVNSDLM